MRVTFLLWALVLAGSTLASASAADLTKIDRTIAKEPVYQTKMPKYCLVVFGDEAKARMWLVLDGKVLHVDRNGDGDLTEADERVEINPKRSVFETTSPLKPAGSEFEYSDLLVRVKDKGRCEIYLSRKVHFPQRNLSAPRRQKLTTTAGFTDMSSRAWMPREDIEEYDFRFGDSPRDAPIVHVDGPLTLRPVFRNQVFVRGKVSRFPVMVGTPGLGQGTFTQVMFWEGDPHGVAEIVFPPRDKKGKPIVVKVALDPPD
jgi:hypothetical protein